MHLVTAVHALDRNQRLPLQAEEAAALAAGLAVAEQRVQAAVGAREAEMQAQAEAALRASVLAQAQQRVQDQVGPPQDSHWHWLGSLLLVQYAQLAMLTVKQGPLPSLTAADNMEPSRHGASSLHMQSRQGGRAL